MQGQIYYVDLGTTDKGVQGGMRPVVVFSNNKFNKFAPCVNVFPITTKTHKESPVHVMLNTDSSNNLTQKSVVLCEQPTTINKTLLKKHIGCLSDADMESVLYAAFLQFGVELKVNYRSEVLYATATV